ncbi:MAG: Lsa36 family surface (lipo)protein [Bacteriovoracaceae bacterium]
MFSRLAALALLSLSTTAFAGPFKLTTCNSGNQTLCNTLETEVNKNLPDADASNYLKGMSNSAALAGKGTGADYATNFDLFVLGVNGGAAVDPGNQSASDFASGKVDSQQLRGFGAQVNGILGLNLSLLPGKFFERSKFYVNAGTFDKSSGDFKVKTSSFGAHYQYKLIKEKAFVGFKLLHWGGVDFTTGMEFSTLDIDYSKTLAINTTVSGQTATYNGPLSVKANVKTTSIPFELTTSLQYLYILSTYVGVAGDINTGKSTVTAASSGTITVAGTPEQGAIDLGSSGKPNAFDSRWLIGQQFNFPLIKIYAQLNQSFTNNTMGAAAGVKIAW